MIGQLRERLLNAWQASPAAAWWQGKASHEQWVYGALAAALLVALFWLGLWRPLLYWQEEQVGRLENARTLLAWVSANEDRARVAARNAEGAAPMDAAAIIPIVTEAATVAGVRLNRLQPESSGTVSVLLQEQPFDQVIGLIAQLQDGRGVLVERASIDAHQAPGHVDAQLRLTSNQ